MDNTAKVRAMIDSAKDSYRENQGDCCYDCHWYDGPDRCELRGDAAPFALCDEFARADKVDPSEEENGE